MDSLEGQEHGASAQPERRPRVRRNVTASIAEDICSERYPSGSTLPRENDLCVMFGVSRTVIRESLKVLESKGLVRGKPRVGILRFETTRGDRLFVSLLGTAFIHLAWLGLLGTSLWWALALSVVYVVGVFRFV